MPYTPVGWQDGTGPHTYPGLEQMDQGIYEAHQILDYQSASAINVKEHGALGNGVADDTSAINTAATVAASVPAPLFFPPGTYNYNGSGVPTNSGGHIQIVGSGRGITWIILGATSSLFNRSTALNNVLISDMSISGGANPIRSTFTGVSVNGFNLVERVVFFNYTGAAISDEADDQPYWMVDACQFRGANDSTTMGVALSGDSSGSTISRCSFENNRIMVKLRGIAGQDVTIDRCSFLRFSTYTSYSRVGVWIVPKTTPVTYTEGAGLRMQGVKFGNEGLNAADDQILIADEGTGTNITTRMPATTQSSGFHNGLYVGSGSWAAANTPAGPFLRTRTPEVSDCDIDLQWVGSLPTEFVTYDYTPTPIGNNAVRRSTNSFRLRCYFANAITAAPRVSNAIGYWQLIDDDRNLFSQPEDHSPISGAGDPTGFVPLWVGSASALILVGSLTTAAATDALGGSDAAELTFSTGVDAAHQVIAPTINTSSYFEIDLKSGSTSSLTNVRVGWGKDGLDTYTRLVKLTANWVRYRLPIKDRAASNQVLITADGASGKVRVGRIMTYHAREPVAGKQVVVRDTTGLTSAQIDALTGVIAVDGGPPIYDPTQGRLLHRVGGKWRYVATTQIA